MVWPTPVRSRPRSRTADTDCADRTRTSRSPARQREPLVRAPPPRSAVSSSPLCCRRDRADGASARVAATYTSSRSRPRRSRTTRTTRPNDRSIAVRLRRHEPKASWEGSLRRNAAPLGQSPSEAAAQPDHRHDRNDDQHVVPVRYHSPERPPMVVDKNAEQQRSTDPNDAGASADPPDGEARRAVREEPDKLKEHQRRSRKGVVSPLLPILLTDLAQRAPEHRRDNNRRPEIGRAHV